MEKDTTYNRNNASDNGYKGYGDKGNFFTDEAGDDDYDYINSYSNHSSYDDEYYD